MSDLHRDFNARTSRPLTDETPHAPQSFREPHLIQTPVLLRRTHGRLTLDPKQRPTALESPSINARPYACDRDRSDRPNLDLARTRTSIRPETRDTHNPPPAHLTHELPGSGASPCRASAVLPSAVRAHLPPAEARDPISTQHRPAGRGHLGIPSASLPPSPSSVPLVDSLLSHRQSFLGSWSFRPPVHSQVRNLAFLSFDFTLYYCFVIINRIFSSAPWVRFGYGNSTIILGSDKSISVFWTQQETGTSGQLGAIGTNTRHRLIREPRTSRKHGKTHQESLGEAHHLGVRSL